ALDVRGLPTDGRRPVAFPPAVTYHFLHDPDRACPRRQRPWCPRPFFLAESRLPTAESRYGLATQRTPAPGGHPRQRASPARAPRAAGRAPPVAAAAGR